MIPSRRALYMGAVLMRFMLPSAFVAACGESSTWLPTGVTVRSVALVPDSVRMDTMATRQFAAVALMSDGSQLTLPAVFTATGGTITSAGLYTSGRSAGTFTVVAADSTGTVGDTSTVVIEPGGPSPTIALSPTSVTFFAITGGSSPAAQTVHVTNAGGGTLGGLALGLVSYAAGASGWLAASIGATSAPATVSLTPTLGSLAAGTYAATVPVTSSASGVTNTPQTINVIFVVNPSGGGSLINAACNPYPTPIVPPPLRTFYVDATLGNDANSGTSLQTAWKTLSRANASAAPGDLVLLRGHFRGQSIHPARSGTATNKIVYKVVPGDSARISVGTWDVSIWLDGLSHIVVDGVEVDSTSNPFLLRYNASNIWLFNLYIHDGGGSVIQGSSDNRVEGSRIFRIGSEVQNSGDAIFIQNGANRNIIVRNTVGYAGHGTIWVSYNGAAELTSDDNVIAQNDTYNPWASGIGLNGKANRTIVECNRMYNSASPGSVNYRRSGLELEGTNNIVRYNEIYHNGAEGITVQGRTFGGFVQNTIGNHVYNNTFWGNGTTSLALTQRDVGIVRNNIFENNIFWNDGGFVWNGGTYAMVFDMYNAPGNALPTDSMGGNIVRNSIFPSGQIAMLVVRLAQDGDNRIYSFAQAMSTFPGWQNLTQSDPLFVNMAGNDVRLQNNSPAIDAGRIIPGQPFLGAAPDLGAREIR